MDVELLTALTDALLLLLEVILQNIMTHCYQLHAALASVVAALG